MRLLTLHFVLTLYVCILLGTNCAWAKSSKRKKKQFDTDAICAEALENDAEQDLAKTFYKSRVVKVHIQMEKKSWTKLRKERPKKRCYPAEDFKYTWYPGTVVINGKTFSKSKIRKKSTCGSLHQERPSLKLKSKEPFFYRNGQKMDDMTLNNNLQDPTKLRQCLSYRMFAQGGLPASECNLAILCVNNEYLGVYTNVEPIKGPFLEENYGNKDGILFEGAYRRFTGRKSDFWTENPGKHFEFKRGDEEKAKYFFQTDLYKQVAEILKEEKIKGSASDVQVLKKLFNWDKLVRFMAYEQFIMHPDGHAGNINNFYMYINKKNKNRVSLIPWGTDQVLKRYTKWNGEAKMQFYLLFHRSRLAKFFIRTPLVHEEFEAAFEAIKELSPLNRNVQWINKTRNAMIPYINPSNVNGLRKKIDILISLLSRQYQVQSDKLHVEEYSVPYWTSRWG